MTRWWTSSLPTPGWNAFTVLTTAEPTFSSPDPRNGTGFATGTPTGFPPRGRPSERSLTAASLNAARSVGEGR